MKVHPITQSYSEAKTYRILDKVLSKRGYKVFASVRLCDVLKTDADSELDEYAESLYRYGHFDFVVCGKKGNIDLFPIFAVEFDGPQHDSDPKQVRKDSYKNRFCKAAGFNMLRITDEQLTEYEKVSLLSFMLERYVCWQEERNRIMDEINDYIRDNPDDPAVVETLQSGICDPSLDPTFLFELKHPYPPILDITRRLAQKRIYTIRSSNKMMPYCGSGDSAFVIFCENIPGSIDYGHGGDRYSHTETFHIIKRKAIISEPYTLRIDAVGAESVPKGIARVLHTVKKTASLKWGCKTGRNIADFPPFGTIEDLFFCDLPGVHIPNMAEQLAEYLCLRDIENWCNQNLPKE